MPGSVVRILIVEDNLAREELLRSWLPGELRAVVATSAGAAIGILKRDPGRVDAGIVLDHDLQERRSAESDGQLTGKDVARAILRHVSRDVSILVHSVNPSEGAVVFQQLRSGGFEVTKIPMDALTEESFVEWAREAVELWRDAEA